MRGRRAVVDCGRGPRGGPRVAVLEYCPHCGAHHPHVVAIDGPAVAALEALAEQLAARERLEQDRSALAWAAQRQHEERQRERQRRHVERTRELEAARARVMREREQQRVDERQAAEQQQARQASERRSRKLEELEQACRELGLGLEFSEADVARALRAKARTAHPDLGGSPEAMTRAGAAALICREALRLAEP